MARTIHSNLTGRAASQELADQRSEYALDRTPQDTRIAKKKAILRKLISPDEFKDFYMSTSRIGDVLEEQINKRLFMEVAKRLMELDDILIAIEKVNADHT